MNKFQLLMDLKAQRSPNHKLVSIEKFVETLTPEEQEKVEASDKDIDKVLNILEE